MKVQERQSAGANDAGDSISKISRGGRQLVMTAVCGGRGAVTLANKCIGQKTSHWKGRGTFIGTPPPSSSIPLSAPLYFGATRGIDVSKIGPAPYTTNSAHLHLPTHFSPSPSLPSTLVGC